MPLDQKIKNIFDRSKKYFLILQGSMGSGKTQFSVELQSLLSEEIEEGNKMFIICSIDDYYSENNYSFEKNPSLAYSYCEKKAKEYIKKGHSVIYNNTNLVENHLKDIVQYAVTSNYYPIIMRFFTTYDEDTCVQIANIYHSIIDKSCVKQSIINDNIAMFQFKNKFEILLHSEKKISKGIPIFGIRSSISQKLNDQYIFDFNMDISNLDELKNYYIMNGWYNEIPSSPRIKPEIEKKEIPELDLGESVFNNCYNIDDIPPPIKYEIILKEQKIKSLEEKVIELENQLKELTIGTIKKGDDRRRQRFDENFFMYNKDEE